MHMKANFEPLPETYPFTPAQYLRMSEQGLFSGDRVELLNGGIIPVAAQGMHHSATIDELRDQLVRIFGAGFWVRTQSTLDLAPHGVPDPDVAVILGDRRAPAKQLPRHAMLVVEVSESTLTHDRTRKASLYASCGILDYWIVNIADSQLEIRRDPQPDSTQEFHYGYTSLTTLRPGANATPLAAPHGIIPVESLFFS